MTPVDLTHGGEMSMEQEEIEYHADRIRNAISHESACDMVRELLSAQGERLRNVLHRIIDTAHEMDSVGACSRVRGVARAALESELGEPPTEPTRYVGWADLP